jgi:3'-5' exoribonuclease
MFPEALMLHYLDDLDSKMEAMRAHFAREAETDGPWTSYNASMGRPLLNSAKLLRTEVAAVPAATSPAAPEPESTEPPLEETAVELFPEQKAEPAAAGTTAHPAKF